MAKKKKRKNSIQKELSTNIETKNNETSTDKRATKRAIVLGTEKKNRKPLAMLLAIAIVILFSGGAFFVMSRGGESASTAIAKTPYIPSGTASQITYPVAMFQDGQALHFEHKGDGVTVKYFILKSSDGIIRAAFDACDVCWAAGKGYYQDGDNMVCRNCSRRFASVRVNEVKGGCNPAPLNRTVEGDQLVIQVKDILDGKQFFNLSGKV